MVSLNQIIAFKLLPEVIFMEAKGFVSFLHSELKSMAMQLGR